MDKSISNDIQWPLNSPNDSILPGIGGMFIKGFGLVRGPPSAPGIPIYYFNPLQPPAFDKGLYQGILTTFELPQQNNNNNNNNNNNSNQNVNRSNNLESEDNNPSFTRSNKTSRPEPEPSSKPYVPIKRDQQKKPEEKPKAAGMGSVLDELKMKLANKNGGGGLKKVDTTEKKQVGKLNVTSGKKGGFVNMMDELKHRLSSMSNPDKAKNETPVANKSDDKPVSTINKSIESKSNEINKQIDKSINKLDSNLVNKIDLKPPNDNTNNTQTKDKDDSLIKYSESIPMPPTLPTTWPPNSSNKPIDSPLKPVDSPIKTPADTKADILNNLLSKNINAIEKKSEPEPTVVKETNILPDQTIDKPASNSNVKFDLNQIIQKNNPVTSTQLNTNLPTNVTSNLSSNLPTNITTNVPTNLPSGVSMKTHQGDLPLPSGYYIPAPRLDMIAPGSFEFAGLTTMNMIERMQKIIRAAVHRIENNLPDKTKVTIDNKQLIDKPLDPVLGDPLRQSIDLISETSSESDDPILELDSYIDNQSNNITSTANESVRRSNNRRVRKPADYFSAISRMRQATTKRQSEQDLEHSLQLRAYDINAEIDYESNRGLPRQSKPLTVPKSFDSAVDKRLKQKGDRTFRRRDDSNERIDPVCKSIPLNPNVASTSAMEGYSDIGYALWISNLRKSNQISSDSPNATDNKSCHPPQLTTSTKLSARKELQRRKTEEQQKAIERQTKDNKKLLHSKAMEQAKRSGNYIGNIGGSYTERLIAKYTYLNDAKRGPGIGKQLLSEKQRYAMSHFQSETRSVQGSVDKAWQIASTCPNYSSAMSLHELMVDSDDIDTLLTSKYQKHRNNNFNS